jgi:hypothetical protein
LMAAMASSIGANVPCLRAPLAIRIRALFGISRAGDGLRPMAEGLDGISQRA